jgi:hypothetical protein
MLRGPSCPCASSDASGASTAPRPAQGQHQQQRAGSESGPRRRGSQQAAGGPRPQQQQQQQQQRMQKALKQRVLTVSPGSDMNAAARLLVEQLEAFGGAELWCTGVASQVQWPSNLGWWVLVGACLEWLGLVRESWVL